MMKKILALLVLMLPFMAFAAEKGLDQKIDEAFGAYTGWFVNLIFYAIPFSDEIQIPWVLIVLVLGALYFTIYFKLINIRGFWTSINIVRGKYDEIESETSDEIESSNTVHTVDGDIIDTIRVEHDADHHGEVSHFQALTAALSATVGLGNIAGVAVALSIGGPGATFWMIVAGLIGMASKFAECTLGVKYREIDENGKVFGGPMYYLRKGLQAKGLMGLGRVLAIVFAIMCIGGSFGGGNMFQSNQAFSMIESIAQTPMKNVKDVEGTVGSNVVYTYFTPSTYQVESVVLGETMNETKLILVGLDTVTLSAKKLQRDSVLLASGTSFSSIESLEKINELKGTELTCFKSDRSILPVVSVGPEEVVLGEKEDVVKVSRVDFVNWTATSPMTGKGAIFGVIMAILVGIVIIGGIQKIAKVTDKIVPFMVVIYVAAALAILFMNFGEIPHAFSQIFSGAFSGAGIAGGAIGVLIQGFQRAAFSNEAGIGSASIAHSAVRTKYAASEGLVALLEPFIDTVLVCTMTALVLVITNGDGEIMTYGEKVTEGVTVTSRAFASAFSWFPYVLTGAVILFAFSTMISWSYYGYQAWSYLFGRTKRVEYIYKALFCLFVIVGAASQLGSVIGFSDAMIFAMLVPNMIGLFILAPKVKEELKKFMDRIKSEGAK